MESGELVAFEDRLLRPSGGMVSTLLDGLADIVARRPTADRFASEHDAAKFSMLNRQLQRLLSPQAAIEERRGHRRVACDLWVTVRWRDQVRPGVIDDVGSGGLFVSTLVAPDVGDPVELTIDPFDEWEDAAAGGRFRCRGRVAWLGTTRRAGFGVAFEVDDDTDAIDRLIVALLHKVAPRLM